MKLPDLLKEKNCTMYRLAKDTGISYSVINDICSGKAKLENCTVGVVYKIAWRLEVSMEDLVCAYLQPAAPQGKRMDFDLFRSYICHLVKELGDLDFIVETLQSGCIRSLYERSLYPEAFYLLAMVDYVCRENQLPVCAEYGDLRAQKLAAPLFPKSILMQAALLKDEQLKQRSLEASIPEFRRFNIAESEVRSLA